MKSEYDDKETFLQRDFSLFISVILCCILNIRFSKKTEIWYKINNVLNENKGGIKCASPRARLIDSEDPKHFRATAFVAIYVLFQG